MEGKRTVQGLQVWSFVFVTILFCVVPANSDDDEQTAPPKITKCWECMNYDPEGNFYSQCPMNGTVDPVRAYLGNCTGSCFTHTDDRNKKLVIRGCSASQWGLPDPLPDDGCYPWYSEIWCICSTDGCNGIKLGVPGKKQFDHHIDYSKPREERGTGFGHHFTPCWTLVFFASAALRLLTSLV